LARPAAGIRAKARAGLHHWQSNTLPQNRTHCPVDDYVKADDVLQHVRRSIADKGIRAAVEVVRNFYAADDDMDELLDVYEFRHACQDSGIVLVASEEAAVLEACGIEAADGAHGGHIHLQKFLRMLHRPLSRQRYDLIEKAFRGVGGDPESEEGVNPAALKQSFTPQGHPLVVKREMDPGILLAEFLDTFSLLAHIRGGCQNGTVGFSDFLAYYDLVSSTIDNDSFFDLLMHRLWPISSDGEERADRWAAPVYEPSSNPTARNRPPAHYGPTAYSNQVAMDEGGQRETHRRFSRTAQGDDAPRPAAYSAITKSSIVFNEAEPGEMGAVLRRLRDALSRRGIKGWLMFSERAQQMDGRRNGGILRLDWQRLQRSLGLGLAPEEQEVLFKGFLNGRRDGAMDFPLCLKSLRAGLLSDKRSAMVDRLFQDLADDSSQEVPSVVLKQSFDAKSVPSCLVGRKDIATERRDFCDAVDHFSAGRPFGVEAFSDFFSMISSCYPEEDEFRLMTSTAFGLSASPGIGGC